MKPKQVLIAIDQLANTLLAGYADETLSARAYRMQDKKKRWKVMRITIDSLFFWERNHCFNAYLSEKIRKHLPEEYSSI